MKTRALHGRKGGAARSGALAIVLLVAMGSGVALASLVRADPYYSPSLAADGKH